MRKPVVLVTSATSRNGCYAAQLLLDTNKFTVRLGTRNPAVLQEFVAHGAEAVVLDSRVESIRRAFSGVHYVYIILPAMPGGGEHLMFKNFLQAVRENGVCKHVVYLSAIDAAFPTEKFATFHKHYEHEQMLIRGGETLRPGEKPRFNLYTKQFAFLLLSTCRCKFSLINCRNSLSGFQCSHTTRMDHGPFRALALCICCEVDLWATSHTSQEP